jgi:hypothetical protein
MSENDRKELPEEQSREAAKEEAKIKQAQHYAMGLEIASQGARIANVEHDVDELQEERIEGPDTLRAISSGVREGIGHSLDIKTELGIGADQTRQTKLGYIRFLMIVVAYLTAFSAGILLGHLAYQAWGPG